MSQCIAIEAIKTKGLRFSESINNKTIDSDFLLNKIIRIYLQKETGRIVTIIKHAKHVIM